MSKKPDSKKPGDSQAPKRPAPVQQTAPKAAAGQKKAASAPAAQQPAATAKAGVASDKARLSISLGKALLLVGLLLIGLSVYLWTQVVELKYAQRSLVEKANRTSAELVRRELDRMSQRMKAERDSNRKTYTAIQGTLDKLGRSVNELQKITGREKQGWKLAEAEFLLAVANHSVRLKQDLQTALVALNEADQRLKEINDPKLFAVRKKIAAEIDQLKAVKRPDIDGLIARLDSVAAQSRTLALFASIPARLKTRSTAPAPAAAGSGTQPKDKSWKTVATNVWKELKTLVVVHHYDKAVPKLLRPEQETAIRQVLDLKLQQARVALLQRREGNYRSALKAVKAWLAEHFDTSDAKVKNAVRTIDTLAAQKVTVVLPDISGSLRQIRHFLSPTTGAVEHSVGRPRVSSRPGPKPAQPGVAAVYSTPAAKTDNIKKSD